MSTNTYVALYSTTLTSDTASITLPITGNISSSYSDLVVILQTSTTHTDNGGRGYIQFNSDISSGNTNYSDTWLGGDGTSAGSSRDTSAPYIAYGVLGNSSTAFTVQTINIMNYSNSTTYKTILSKSGNPNASGNKGTRISTGLWRNTNAITSMTFTCDGSYRTNTTITVYGIQSA